MRTLHARARRGKKAASPSTHPLVSKTEVQIFADQWAARGLGGEMSSEDLRRAPLPELLMHGLAFEEGPPVRSMLHALRAQIDGTLQTATAGGEACSVELTLSTLDAWRRRLDVAIELDRRGAR
jgi:hypothetical protein